MDRSISTKNMYPCTQLSARQSLGCQAKHFEAKQDQPFKLVSVALLCQVLGRCTCQGCLDTHLVRRLPNALSCNLPFPDQAGRRKGTKLPESPTPPMTAQGMQRHFTSLVIASKIHVSLMVRQVTRMFLPTCRNRVTARSMFTFHGHARALSHEPSPASARADASARAQLSTSAQSARSGGSKAQRGSRRAELISKLKAGPNLAKAEGTQRGALKRLKGLKLRRKADTNLEDALQLEIDDVAESLGLTADPKVLEIGDEKLLKLKKSGKLNPQDDSIISAFKKHKATIGKALFEAENANNLGVEMYLLGDYHTAAGYFDQALQLTSEKKKSASAELAVLKAFVAEKYGGSEELLYTDLVKGEWRSALGHNKFVEAPCVKTVFCFCFCVSLRV